MALLDDESGDVGIENLWEYSWRESTWYLSVTSSKDG
jgi:hypothetical protein